MLLRFKGKSNDWTRRNYHLKHFKLEIDQVLKNPGHVSASGYGEDGMISIFSLDQLELKYFEFWSQKHALPLQLLNLKKLAVKSLKVTLTSFNWLKDKNLSILIRNLLNYKIS